ncbi:hypothetical protein WA158_006842 [Blastocystis sp. Blastoise]
MQIKSYQKFNESISSSSWDIDAIITKHDLLDIENKGNQQNYTLIIQVDTLLNETLQYVDHNLWEYMNIAKYIIVNEKLNSELSVNSIDPSFSFPFIVRQNFDIYDHISFAYGIFFPSVYLFYFDMRIMKGIDRNEFDRIIRESLQLIYQQNTSFTLCYNNMNNNMNNNNMNNNNNVNNNINNYNNNNNNNIYGCYIGKQSIVRKYLLNTNMNRNSENFLSFLARDYDAKHMNYSLYYTKKIQYNYQIPLGNTIQFNNACEIPINKDYSVTIGTYARNYIQMSLEMIQKQTLKPKYIVIYQNMDYVHFINYTQYCPSIPIFHIWCTNWNSIYFGRYLTSILYETSINIMLDDDFFFNDPNTFQDVISQSIQSNDIYGLASYRLHDYYTPFFVKEETNMTKRVDHIGVLTVFHGYHVKNMFKFPILTYRYSEDMYLSLSNNIICGSLSYKLNINNVTDNNEDELQSSKTLKSNTELYVLNNITHTLPFGYYNHAKPYGVYNFFIDLGYKPYYYEYYRFRPYFHPPILCNITQLPDSCSFFPE